MAGKKKAVKAEKTGLGCLTRLIILVVILILVVYVAGKMFFPVERVKAEIVSRAEQMLGRHVEIDDLSFSIFPTPRLDLQGVRVYNPPEFPGAEFVSIDNLVCGLKVWPLLKRQIVFAELSVKHPVLTLRKAADGRTNYSFELNTGDQPVETPLGPKEKITSEEAAMTAFAFDWAEIQSGDLTYIDDSAGAKTVLSNFSLDTRLIIDADGLTGQSSGKLTLPSISSTLLPENLPLDIEIAYNAEVDFQHADLVLKNSTLKVNGIPFQIEATVRNLSDPRSVFAKIKADGVSLTPLVDYIPKSESFDPGLLRIQGTVNGDIEGRMEFGKSEAPYVSGILTFNDLTVGYQTVSTRAHFDALKVNFSADSVSFASQGGSLSEHEFAISGTAKNWDDLQYAVKTSGQYELIGLLPFLDQSYNHKLSGSLRFNLGVTGQKSTWVDSDLRGKLSVINAYYTNDSLTSPLERLDMAMTFGEKQVTVDSLYIEYPGVYATMTGTLSNGFAHLIQPREGHKKPYFDFKLHAPLVNYDILVPVEDANAVAAGGAAGELAAPIFLPDITAGGSVVIDTLIYTKLDFTNITGDVTYDDGIITFKKAKGNLYTGTVSGEGTIDLTDFYTPRVICAFDAKNIEANDFMARFANLDGHLYGKANIKGTLDGAGAEFEDFLGSMIADGTIDMSQGRLVNFNLINDMAAKFGFKTFQEEDLRDLASKVKIRAGKLLLEDTKVLSKMGDWNVAGTVGFLKKDLDLYVSVYLSPEYAKQVDVLGGMLLDKAGRLPIGFNLSGPYSSPSISNLTTDQSAAKEKVEDKVKKEAGNLIKKLFDKK